MSSAKEISLLSASNEVLPLGTTKEVNETDIDPGTDTLEGSSYGFIVGMGLSLSGLMITEMSNLDTVQGFILAGVTFAGSVGVGSSIGYISGKRKGIEKAIRQYKPDYFYSNLKAIEKSSWQHVVPFKKSNSRVILTKDGKPREEVVLVSHGKKVYLEYLKQESPGKAWDEIMDTLQTAYNITPKPKKPVSTVAETISYDAPQSKGILTRVKAAWSKA